MNGPSPSDTLRDCIARFKAEDWPALADLEGVIPAEWGPEWLAVADKVSFALGQMGNAASTARAERLVERAFALDPTRQRASALAYLSYAALFRNKSRRERLPDPEATRKRFEHWIGRALEIEPGSLTDRYRLAMYHASIRSQRDVPALAEFKRVLGLFERLPADKRAPGTPEFKRYVRSLYGASRSCFRLRRLDEARRFGFACIRADRDRDHVPPVFKLFLSARILFEQGRLDDAERALRLAIAAPHEGSRDFVYGLLAQISLARRCPGDAFDWIALHVRPQHRKPYLWRLMGDCEVQADRPGRAIPLYKSALLKDRAGRHRTLVRMGSALEKLGRIGEARRAYEQAADFRRRRYLSEDEEALKALAGLYETSGDLDRARETFRRLSQLPMLASWAEEQLQRLAG